MAYSYSDLTCFIAVVDHGQFSRAADALQLTQPAVTKIIQRLEASVGIPLFQRSNHGVALTVEGMQFLPPARRLIQQHRDLQRIANDLQAGHIGLVRIGLTLATSTSAIRQAITTLIRHRPGLRIKLDVDKSDQLNIKLNSGALDFIVIPNYGPAQHSEHLIDLGSDELVVAARIKHPLALAAVQSRQDVHLAQTQGYGWALPSQGSKARDHIESRHHALNLAPPTVILEIQHNIDAVIDIVAHTDLLCFIPVQLLRKAHDRLEKLPINGMTLQRQWLVVHRPDSPCSTLVLDLMTLLQAVPHKSL